MKSSEKCSYLLGILEMLFIMLGRWTMLWIPIYRCETESQTVSSFLGMFIMVVVFDAFKKAMKKGFHFGYIISGVAILSSLWYFYVSQGTIKDMIFYGCIVTAAIIDIIRTRLLHNSSNGMLRVDSK